MKGSTDVWFGTLCALLLFSCLPPPPPQPQHDLDGDDVDEDEGDCDDQDATIYPGAQEVPYDGIDQDCDDADLVDVDRDGWEAVEAGGDDCDDTDANVHPDAEEEPYDGQDNDCVEGDLTDVDGDGYDSTEVGGDDCEDWDPDVHPGALDDCGNGDEDCDGDNDEDADADADGYTTCQGDCDDSDASVSPDGEEIAQDGIDQNCNDVDLGDCPDSILETGYNFEFDAYFDDCEDGIESAYSHFWDYGQVPEDADCSGNSATWSDHYSGEIASIQVEMNVNFSAGSGSFSGGGSYDGSHCDDVSGSVEID